MWTRNQGWFSFSGVGRRLIISDDGVRPPVSLMIALGASGSIELSEKDYSSLVLVCPRVVLLLGLR